MSNQNKRILRLLVIGILLVVGAIVARKEITTYRKLAVERAKKAGQKAVELELVRLHEAARLAPNDKTKQWDLANFYIKYNINDKAADQLATIIHLDHDDVPALSKLADISLDATAYSAAEFYYREVIKRQPRSVPAWQGLGSALILERRFYEAMNVAEHCVELDGTNAKSRLIGASALLNYALQYPDPLSHSDYIETARQQLVALTRVMPNSGEVFYEYGRALVALQHREEAIPQLEHAVKLSPDNGDAARLLAIAYENVNKNDKALTLLKELNIRQPDNPGTNDMLGQLQLESKEPGALQGAIVAFQKAARKLPNDQYINERLAEAYEKANDLPSARKSYEHVTQINPNRSFSFHKLALIYTRLSEPALAKKASDIAEHLAANEQQFKTIQELSAKHPDDVNLHLIIADRFLEMKMYAPARDEYFQVLRLDPKNKKVPRQFMAAAATEIRLGLY